MKKQSMQQLAIVTVALFMLMGCEETPSAGQEIVSTETQISEQETIQTEGSDLGSQEAEEPQEPSKYAYLLEIKSLNKRYSEA